MNTMKSNKLNGMTLRLLCGIMFSLCFTRSHYAQEASFTVTLDQPIHGKVQLSPVLPPDSQYSGGTKVTVTATPDAGYAFDAGYYSVPGRWGAMYFESMTNPFTITIDRDQHIGASFVEAKALKGFRMIQDVIYARPGVKPLRYDVYTPDGAKKLPCIVIIHGGGWSTNTEDIMRGLARELVKSSQYVVCSIDYRWLGTLDGDDTPNTMVNLIEDVFGAIAHIQEHAHEYGADPGRLAVTGDSAGGHLSATAANMVTLIGAGGEGAFEYRPTYMPSGKSVQQVRRAMTQAIQAAAPSYGVFAGDQLRRFVRDVPEDWLKAISPMENIPNVQERAVPQLLLRGTADMLIRDEPVQVYADALKTAGQTVSYVQVEGANHAFFDWKPEPRTKETFLQYGVPYAAKMKSFFDAVFYAATPASNPVIWADVPDVAVIRVGDTYYMSSTTMHMSPGLPIMKSKNLVDWNLIGYAYDRLVENDAMNLENNRTAYGQGSWASSLRFHNGTYYATTFSSTSGRTHVYTTRDIEKGDWKATSFAPSLHDNTLFFDDDGRVYMVYGAGKLTLVELEPDLSGIKPGGVNKVIIENVNLLFGENEVGGLNGEGAQLLKVNGTYYLMNIGSPRSRWSRSVLISRADTITGPYEGRVGFEDQGVAQGCLIDTPDGKWYAMLFQDNGSVGRSPWLVPVAWEDGWPVFGVDGKAPKVTDIEDTQTLLDSNIVISDEFDRKTGEALPMAWQWNHNPDNGKWSIGERVGHLRLTTGRIDSSVLSAKNTLTQRTFAPASSATTKVDVTHMKDGDYAGMIALQARYGQVCVKMENGSKSIVMMTPAAQQRGQRGQRGRRNPPSPPVEVESVPLTQNTAYFKVDCDYRNRADKAFFYYSLDGKTWIRIGSVVQMTYSMPHFMGYRFGLFNYATKAIGGHADFDYYHVTDEISVD